MRAKDIVPPLSRFHEPVSRETTSPSRAPAASNHREHCRVDRRPWEPLWHDLKTASSSIGRSSAKSLVVIALTLLGAVIRLWSPGRLGLVHFDEGIYALAGLWSLLAAGIGRHRSERHLVRTAGISGA